MAVIERPVKTGGTRTYATEVAGGNTTIRSAEVDADLNTAYAEVNGNLDNANIKPAAGIATTKIAQDGGIVAGHIAASAVTNVKLATDAVTKTKITAGETIRTSASDAFALAVTIANTTETEITTGGANITASGGQVLIIGTLAAWFNTPNNGADATIIIRLKLDGATIDTWQVTITAPSSGASQDLPMMIPILSLNTPTAGSRTYTVTVQISPNPSNAFSFLTDSANAGLLRVQEAA